VVGFSHIDFQGIELRLKEDESTAYADPAEVDYGTRTAAGAIVFPKTLGLVDTTFITPSAATEVSSTTDSTTTASATNTTDLQYAATVTVTVDETTDVFEVTASGISTVTVTGGPGSPEGDINLRYRVNAGAWTLLALAIPRAAPSAATPFAIAGSVTGLSVGATVDFAVEAVAVESGGTGTVNHLLTAMSMVVTKVKR
jgi:hypothetical protein